MEAKTLLRSRLRTARARRSPDELSRAEESLARHGLAAWSGLGTVAAYAGIGTEPPTRTLLDGLLAAGVRVLLPVVTGPVDLAWGDYAGWDALAPGPHGLLEPRTAAASLSDAEVVVVPALAVDGHGHRLGRGVGYYDRALAAVTAARVAVVFDDELVEEVPAEAHDIAVGGALTPAGLRRF